MCNIIYPNNEYALELFIVFFLHLSHLDVRSAGALSAHDVTVVVYCAARVTVAGFAAVGVAGEPEVLGPALVAVPPYHVPLAPALT